MPTPTYTPLATVTLGTAASVTFSNIPSTYRDLIFVVRGTSLNLRVNGDTGSNYSNVSMYGTGSTAASGSETTTFFYTNWFGTGTTANRMYICQFMDYSATDKHKTILLRGDLADAESNANAGRWANTSAITSISIVGTPAAGSTFSLYGIAS
jgi:hypothetical protein